MEKCEYKGRRFMKKLVSMILLIVLLVSPIKLFATNHLQETSKEVDEYLKGFELQAILDKKEENIKSIREQLEEMDKMEHFEFHKKALDNEFDKIINTLNGEITPMEDNAMIWGKGEIVHYKSTEESFYTNVLEYYDPKGTKKLVDEWIIEKHLDSIRDWKKFVSRFILTKIPAEKLGFAASAFYEADEIRRYISDRALLKAYDSETGAATVHYYIGPFEDDSSAVVWTWDTYPVVYQPSSKYNDVIRYYMN